MKIIKANTAHISAIILLAERTWKATYSTLVAASQIEYMLDIFYNENTLIMQMNDPQHHFLVMMDEDVLVGYSHCIEMEGKIKLSKLYFAPERQGQGLGKQLMNAVIEEASQLGFSLIELFVNRGNPAQYFYEKMGFQIIEHVDVPIGDYWMNDYIMHRKIS